MSETEEHLTKLFSEWIKAEELLHEAEKRLSETSQVLQLEVNGLSSKVKRVREEIGEVLQKNGVLETIIPGKVMDYKVYFPTPKESVKVEDVNAVPDEWCRVERKANLKEIGEYMKGLREVDAPLPNWAIFQTGETKVSWKAVKK